MRERSGPPGGQAGGAGGEHGCCGIWNLGGRAAETGAAANGVDEIHLGKKQKFRTMASNL